MVERWSSFLGNKASSKISNSWDAPHLPQARQSVSIFWSSSMLAQERHWLRVAILVETMLWTSSNSPSSRASLPVISITSKGCLTVQLPKRSRRRESPWALSCRKWLSVVQQWEPGPTRLSPSYTRHISRRKYPHIIIRLRPQWAFSTRAWSLWRTLTIQATNSRAIQCSSTSKLVGHPQEFQTGCRLQVSRLRATFTISLIKSYSAILSWLTCPWWWAAPPVMTTETAAVERSALSWRRIVTKRFLSLNSTSRQAL